MKVSSSPRINHLGGWLSCDPYRWASYGFGSVSSDVGYRIDLYNTFAAVTYHRKVEPTILEQKRRVLSIRRLRTRKR